MPPGPPRTPAPGRRPGTLLREGEDERLRVGVEHVRQVEADHDAADGVSDSGRRSVPHPAVRAHGARWRHAGARRPGAEDRQHGRAVLGERPDEYGPSGVGLGPAAIRPIAPTLRRAAGSWIRRDLRAHTRVRPIGRARAPGV
jgi:hypothetical protein